MMFDDLFKKSGELFDDACDYASEKKEEIGAAVGAGAGCAGFAHAAAGAAVAATTGLSAAGVAVAAAVPLAGAVAGVGLVKGGVAIYDYFTEEKEKPESEKETD